MLDIKLKLTPGHTSERSPLKPSPLVSLFWNITYACNYRCEVCFTSAGRRDPEELSTDEAKEVIRRTHDAGVKDIILSGGEPFMRDDIVEIVAYMAEMGMVARFASNGSLLTDEILGQLRDRTLTKSFQISLDTLDPVLYQKIHRSPPGALAVALNSLRRIQEHGFHTTVSVRLTPETMPGIPDILDRASAEGWATVTIHWPLHTRRIKDGFPQDADFLSLLEPVFERFLALPKRWLVETYIPWAPYHPVIKRLEQQIRVVHRGCAGGRDHLTINPTGLISPCVCLDVPEAHVGDIRTDDILDVFNNSPLCKMVRSPQEYGICVDCPEVGTCGGGCRASAFVLTGRLDGQDTACPIWQTKKATPRAATHVEP
ncbi:MAG: radical SAM protein [Planctomycetes bacterium]|nr:radical SAM protein [Planctomycetota bacterium]